MQRDFLFIIRLSRKVHFVMKNVIFIAMTEVIIDNVQVELEFQINCWIEIKLLLMIVKTNLRKDKRMAAVRSVVIFQGFIEKSDSRCW